MVILLRAQGFVWPGFFKTLGKVQRANNRWARALTLRARALQPPGGEKFLFSKQRPALKRRVVCSACAHFEETAWARALKAEKPKRQLLSSAGVGEALLRGWARARSKFAWCCSLSAHPFLAPCLSSSGGFSSTLCRLRFTLFFVFLTIKFCVLFCGKILLFDILKRQKVPSLSKSASKSEAVPTVYLLHWGVSAFVTLFCKWLL